MPASRRQASSLVHGAAQDDDRDVRAKPNSQNGRRWIERTDCEAVRDLCRLNTKQSRR